MKLADLDTFTKHYLIAALWSSMDEAGEPLDKEHSLSDFSQEALAKAKSDCAAFEATAAPLLDHAYASPEYEALESHPDNGGAGVYALAGHDFWLSRNGHGAGFFDRGNARFWRGLQTVARDTGCIDLYKGDDGKLYFA